MTYLGDATGALSQDQLRYHGLLPANPTRKDTTMTNPGDGDQGAIVRIYCDQCDRTIYYTAHGDDEGLFADARDGDPEALADLEEIRGRLLTTHKMECAA